MRAFFERPTTADRRVIGSEYEALAVDVKTGRTVQYDSVPGIEPFLGVLRDQFGWAPVEEHGHLVALLRDGQSITLEPGGQFEMSGAPLRTLAQTEAEVQRHYAEL